MNVIEQLGLRQDPFGPASSATGFGVAASLLVAQEKLLAAVGRGDPLTVLTGRPGMGKTLLLAMVEQAYRGDGIDVRSVARGDMAHVALGSHAQLLLIDEADTINTATLKALAPGTAGSAAPMMVFAVARPALHRLSSDVRATIIDLRPLDPEESRDFLLARAAAAGRLDLFTPEALDVIVDAGQGSPRLLRVLAGAAMFQAASDGAAQIGAAHAALAAAMHGKLLSLPAAEPELPAAANDLEPALAEDRPRNLVPLALRRSRYQRAGALSFAASVALAALVLPLFVFPESADAPSVGVTSASAAQATSAPVQLAAAAFTVAPARAAAPLPLRLPRAAAEPPRLRLAAAMAPPLIAAPPRISTAALDTRVASIRPVETQIVTEGAGIARAARPEPAAGADRALLIDLLAATRLRPAVAERESGGQGAAEELASPIEAPAAMLLAAVGPTAAPPAATLASAPAVTTTFAPLPTIELRPPPSVATPAVIRPADEARTTKLAALQSKDAAREADNAKDAADQAKAAKHATEQSKAVKEAAEQAKAGKGAADQAKAVKQAADQAKAAKDAAEQSKAAKVAAEQAKESAEQAKAVKEAVEQAKAAKDAADPAKTVKEAVEQAKAAKDAADQAKAAKEAADQAKAAKEAVDQAKAAKDAADQAKAAKEAVEQAKAAKEAADQAKAAKEAVEQAKAAKDAADQAKAAKEAADQAKAAREAADQAKDAVAQAKAAKDAADQAKEAAKAAKDAAKAAKDAIKAAREAGKGN
jgi:hypothetical protein